MNDSDFLSLLNEHQKDAVLHRGSPLLILAGAGSGKTRVITTRIAQFIAGGELDPRSILAVTFTNKAAREMAERVTALVPGGRDVMIRTFHSFGAWLLRRHASYAGLSTNFTIYDDDDSLTLLHSLYPSFKRKDLKPYVRWIARAKDYALSPDDPLDEISHDPRFREMYESYQNKLEAIGNADFGDLILKPFLLLRQNPDIRARFHQRFRAIMVDEYQDSNVAQYRLLKELYGEGTDLCVVGDDDQSIYRFRGAEVQNILSFDSHFEGTKIIRLEENYRSTGNILHLASGLVSKNKGRLGKTLWTRNDDGPRPRLVYLPGHEAEAEFCADLLDDRNYRETAILYRTNAQSLAFESCFLQRNIPYRVIGALRFYEREEIKDALALLALLLNPGDEVAFRRMINKPRRGIGPGSLEDILENAASYGRDLLMVLEEAVDGLSSRAARGAREFRSVMKTARENLSVEPLGQMILHLVTDAGLIQYYSEQDEIGSTQRVANLEELVNAAQKYPFGEEGLCSFLEDIELDRSRMSGEEEDGDFVTLITMHNTKGLEFDRVIITGLEQDIFPGYRSRQDPDDLEEERRIFYVAITRAKRELYLTSSRQRLIWGRMQEMMPSVFLCELPEEGLDIVNEELAAADTTGAGGFTPGTGVYHDDYGTGQVIKSWNNGKYDIVLVRFQSGKTAQFIPAYAPLERISLDF